MEGRKEGKEGREEGAEKGREMEGRKEGGNEEGRQNRIVELKLLTIDILTEKLKKNFLIKLI